VEEDKLEYKIDKQGQYFGGGAKWWTGPPYRWIHKTKNWMLKWWNPQPKTWFWIFRKLLLWIARESSYHGKI